MKGSPMHRNFGIGSPAKHTMSEKTNTRISKEQAAKHNSAPASSHHSGTPHKQFEEGDYYDTRSKKSPMEQFEEGDYYDTRSAKKKKAENSSSFKQTYDANGYDDRADNVNQREYDKWRGTEDINTGEKGNAPNIRYLGQKENKKWLDKFLAWKESGAELPTTPE